MNQYLFNVSNGQPKKLLPSILWAFFEGLTKILPAVLMIDVFQIMFNAFTSNSELDIDRLWTTVWILIGWLVVSYIASYYSYDASFLAAYELSAKGRIDLAEHMRQLPLGYLESKDPADLTNRMLDDYARVEHAISYTVPQLMSSMIFPSLAFFCLLFVNWKMAIAMFIAMPLALLVLWLANRFQHVLFKNQIAAKNSAGNLLQEYISCIKEMKAYQLGGEKFTRLDEAFKKYRDTSIKTEALIGPITMLSLVFIRSGMTFMIFVGSYLLIDGELTLPIFLMFLIICLRVFEPMTVVLNNYALLKYEAMSASRIMELKQEPVLTGQVEVNKIQEITFEDVTFRYKQENQPVLRDVSLTIPYRKITALVGPSGSGKTTITKLIARFGDIEKGEIFIDGRPIESITPESLLSKISMVFQQVYLFNDTIYNNILVGNRSASKEQVIAAAKAANCHDFIMNFPNGYDTLVGEGGSTLSGGEKQRISIARALLKDADIILLDEPTAALDPENELEVQKALNRLIENKTVVLIAHRLQTIKNADQIIVLDNGHVVETGNHESLRKQKGLYNHLWNIQQGASGWQLKQ